MAGPVPHVLSFGGGAVLEGGADTKRTDELEECDGYDLGSRGQLIAARDQADYVTINDLNGAPAAWTALHALRSVAGNNFVKEIAIGEGKDGAAAARYLLAQFLRAGAVSPIGGATDIKVFTGTTPRAEGVLVTVAAFPGTYIITNAAATINVFLVNIGAREGFAANLAPGLWVAYAIPPATEILLLPISTFDALGTGSRGEFAAGTKGKQLYFRGMAAYNSHALGWGFDSADLTDKDGPARLMFANPAKPLKWGNDNKAAVGTDRDFSDTDAIPVGDAGEVIRAGLSWNTRFYIGTDKQLHFLAGYGRDSFLTDGSNPVAKSENVIGPNALVEGPNKLLYGVSDQGLWAFDGQSFEPHHRRLRDFAGASKDWWDLIWTDRLRSTGYPGQTNADLVWMVTDWDNEQVVIGIPWCNATGGRGYGTDTVLIKFHVRTGGFSRQVMSGINYTAADYTRRARQYASTRFLGTASSGKHVRKYGERDASSGQIASPLPRVKPGGYALFGPDGVGVYDRMYGTLAWDIATGLAAWITRASAADDQWQSVTCSPEVGSVSGGRMVAVTDSGANTSRVMTSDDGGATWVEQVTPNFASEWVSVCWSPQVGKFVAVAHTALAQSVMYATTGFAWTEVALAHGAWRAVCWAAELGLYCAVADGTIGNDVVTSPDAIVWTTHLEAALNDWRSVCWGPGVGGGAGRFVAVSNTGAGNRVMTSDNGVAWTSRVSAADLDWRSVCWSPERALYVAVASSGAGKRVMTSPDGITWTLQDTPVDNDWRSVTWSPELALFVAVAATGAGNRIMTSPDGKNWSPSPSPADNDWSSVAWNSVFRTFAAVGVTGVGNRVMTSSAVPATPDLRFKFTPFVDGQQLTAVRLSVKKTAPTGPAEGDYWVDVSGTDANLGNATAGAIIPAAADYLVKRRYNGAWINAFVGGQKDNRVTVPITFTPTRGTRLSVRVEAEQADRRWQWEGLGFEPGPVASAL